MMGNIFEDHIKSVDKQTKEATRQLLIYSKNFGKLSGLNIGKGITKKQVIECLKKYRNVCKICGKKITDMREFNIDHFNPKVRGGSNKITNLILAHSYCNRKKSSKKFKNHEQMREWASSNIKSWEEIKKEIYSSNGL